RIAETEKTLMSGAVTNPKELENLQQSLDSLRRHRAAVEDKAMEALLQSEETSARLQEERATLAALEADWRAGQGELGEEETKMKRNFLILRKQRENAVAAVDKDRLAEYERMRKRKAGVAVAAIENGECGACHVQLPTGVISAARTGDGLVYCTSCGRILHAG
ncbi:MAG: C4-type zinc ribbon domain-containing protein, partial [Caldilineaceae bacterium]